MVSRNTRFYLTIFPPNAPQQWLVNSQTVRDKNTGTLILWPDWSTDPSKARSMTYEYAVIFAERFQREQGHKVHMTLEAGSKEFLEDSGSPSSNGQDERTPVAHEGYVVRPAFNVRESRRCWVIRLHDERGDLEPIRADSPDEAVQKMKDRHLESKAERAIPAAPVETSQPVAVPRGPRIRPGSFR